MTMHSSTRLRIAFLAAFAVAIADTAIAQNTPIAADLNELRVAVDSLKAEQARSQARIAELERALTRAQAQLAAPLPTSPSPTAAQAPTQPSVPTPSVFNISGDMRMRYEGNFGDNDAPTRSRGVFRARMRGSYAVNDWFSVGGQIATGDNDDPNSTDITLSNFDDDLTASLDQAYIRLSSGGFQADFGKMPQPFIRTELVWGGDVSPQGVAASYIASLNGGAKMKATGLYFLVDEAAAGPDSTMAGGQISFESSTKNKFKVEASAAYFDYSLRSLTGGDTGDFRSNRFIGGRYASDFKLLDFIGAVTFTGAGEAWPIRFVADYVRNSGAVNGDEDGFGVDLIAGRASQPGDIRFTYGFAKTAPDAVFAAFSHDNTNIATNYLQHTLAADYVVARNVVLNATFYHYRPNVALFAGSNAPGDWLDRLRLNLMASF